MFSGYRKKLENLPWFALLNITVLGVFGLVMMYAAGGGSFYPYASKQVVFFIVFYILMLFIIFIDLRIIFSASYLAYFLALILLTLVDIVGHKAMGATRWISFGFFKMQPSELMKICLVLSLAKYFHANPMNKNSSIVRFIIPSILVSVPSLVIIKQPDLGTAIIMLMVGGAIFFIVGLRIRYMVITLLLILAAAPVMWSKLHGYQKKRVEIFLNPELDPLGSGYNIIQSKIAIGSGGFAGKGFLEGTQAQLDFLPEHQTDFVFPMFAEEFGYIGAVVLLLLYLFLMVYGIKVANYSKLIFGRVAAFGLISIFTFHIIVNLFMVMGMAPVVGVPLPFMSYGGTILGTTFIIFGIIINIDVSRKLVLPNNDVNYLF